MNYGGFVGLWTGILLHETTFSLDQIPGKWDIVDGQDCQDAPRLLADAPYSLIDGSRVAIRGGSAGGFTTLASISIVLEPGFCKAATSSYGVSDLVSLAQFTHKFCRWTSC